MRKGEFVLIMVLFTAALTAMAGFLVYFSFLQPEMESGNIKKQQDTGIVYAAVLFTFGLIARLIIAGVYHGHETDMNCFSGWSTMIFKDGMSAFYSSDTFTDYPPGYMYVLYVIGAIRSFLPISGGGLDILLKTPAIVCDMITGVFVYNLAKKKYSETMSICVGGFFILNPAMIINSSFWGQVDSVFTLFLVLMVYFVSEKKMIQSYFMFTLAIFIKPQAFIFTPIIIYGIIENVFLPKFNKDLFWKNLLCGLGAIAMIFILALPFGIGNVINQYVSTMASYPYATVNAFNIWGALGQNWVKITPFTKVFGHLLIVLVVAVTWFIFRKSKSGSKYYFMAAVLAFGTYMLSSQMHERYAYPAMVMLLLAFVALPDVKLFVSYILLSVSQIINTAWVLFVYSGNPNGYFKSPFVIVMSFLNIVFTVYIGYTASRIYIKNEAAVNVLEKQISKSKETKNVKMPKKKTVFAKTKELAKLTRFDIIAMAVITVVYAGIALYDLGDMKAPQSYYQMKKNDVIALDLGYNANVNHIKYFLGVNENREFTLTVSEDGTNFSEPTQMKMVSVFAWGEQYINEYARYICIKCDSDEAMINELAVIDEHGERIVPVNADSYKGLFDEQDLVVERSNFRNSTYFDEIYHARTAYEFIHGLTPYEWTHPPLGKVFISIGILIFGMVPFGWRIVGTVFGIIMVPVIYCFAKKITKYTWLAIVTCLLFTFDFMHFAQTRIATIDVYVTLFIMLMYYFMYKYYCTSFYDTKFGKTLIPLGLSGIFMGMGIASKWTGVYAGCGLAVLFFMTLFKRYREYRYALSYPNESTDGISHKFVIENFKKYTVKTILFCVGFFVAIPVLIYGLSYIPYLQADGMQGIKSILDNQSAMLTYHGKTVVNSTHSFSSHWYEWPIMARPIWYFSGTVTNTVKEGISSFGNPAVWWTSIAAFIYMIYLAVRYKDKTALFLVIAYLAQLVSWIPVTRITFIYHYFPCVPFLVLMLGYAILKLYNENKNVKYFAFGYAAVVIILFAMFYPVLSGHPVNVEYVKNYLKWFDSWVLISTQ